MTRRFLLTIISLLIALPSLTAAPNAVLPQMRASL